jgi:hypothetical protein
VKIPTQTPCSELAVLHYRLLAVLHFESLPDFRVEELGDWQARWVTLPGQLEASQARGCACLRFLGRTARARARLEVCARGSSLSEDAVGVDVGEGRCCVYGGGCGSLERR